MTSTTNAAKMAEFEQCIKQDQVADMAKIIMENQLDQELVQALMDKVTKERKDLILPMAVTISLEYDTDGDKFVEEHLPYQAVKICEGIAYG